MLSHDWLDAVTEIVARKTRTVFRPLGLNTCVASSRVLHTVLNTHGVENKPTAVAVMAMNAEAHRYVLNGEKIQSGFVYGAGPQMSGAKRAPAARNTTGQLWNAHMVLSVECGSDSEIVIADVTAPQFHYPQYGVHVAEAITFPSPRDEWEAGLVGGLPLQDGAALLYWRLQDHVPESQTWKKCDAWTTEPEGNMIMAALCLPEIAALEIPKEISAVTN